MTRGQRRAVSINHTDVVGWLSSFGFESRWSVQGPGRERIDVQVREVSRVPYDCETCGSYRRGRNPICGA